MFTPTNPAKYAGNPKGIVYRSLWEKYVMAWADRNADVVKWMSEEIQVEYLYEVDKQVHRYFCDFYFETRSGKKMMVEVKPYKETLPPVAPKRKTKRFLEESLTYVKNQNKWEAARAFCAKRGWEFHVWTENELRAMNIMPKALPKIKRMKKLASLPR